MPQPQHRPCIFCDIVNGTADASVVYEDEKFLAFLDVMPVSHGHLLVIPKEHHTYTTDMPPALLGELAQLGQRIAKAYLSTTAHPAEGMHLLWNNGQSANQTVFHVHFHIIPRRQGDKRHVTKQFARKLLTPIIGHTPRKQLDELASVLRHAIANESNSQK